MIQMALLSISGSVMFLRGMAGVRDVLPAAAGILLSPAVGVTLAVFSVVSGMAVMFWLSVGVLAALDLLFTGSGRVRRLIECSALAYWSQVPWSLATIGIMLWWFDPAPLRLPPGVGQSELPALVAAYQADLQSTPLMETVGIVGLYFGLWLVVLQAAALRVVSGFSVGGTWASGILMAVLFVGLPYAVQWFW